MSLILLTSSQDTAPFFDPAFKVQIHLFGYSRATSYSVIRSNLVFQSLWLNEIKAETFAENEFEKPPLRIINDLEIQERAMKPRR